MFSTKIVKGKSSDPTVVYDFRGFQKITAEDMEMIPAEDYISPDMMEEEGGMDLKPGELLEDYSQATG